MVDLIDLTDWILGLLGDWVIVVWHGWPDEVVDCGIGCLGGFFGNRCGCGGAPLGRVHLPVLAGRTQRPLDLGNWRGH